VAFELGDNQAIGFGKLVTTQTGLRDMCSDEGRQLRRNFNGFGELVSRMLRQAAVQVGDKAT
jgi:hypothetical protein